jgi:hypothetical protein
MRILLKYQLQNVPNLSNVPQILFKTAAQKERAEAFRLYSLSNCHASQRLDGDVVLVLFNVKVQLVH